MTWPRPARVRRGFGLPAPLVALAVLACGRAFADSPFPLPVFVQVVQKGTVAADRSLRMLETAIVAELRRNACDPDAKVGAGDESSEPSALLRVVIEDVLEEAQWSLHTGDRAEAQQRGGDEAVTPHTSVRVLGRTEVLALPRGSVVRTRKFNVLVGWSSRSGGGDPAEEVRAQAIDRVAGEARRTLCSSRGKLVKQFAALEAPAQP